MITLLHILLIIISTSSTAMDLDQDTMPLKFITKDAQAKPIIIEKHLTQHSGTIRDILSDYDILDHQSIPLSEREIPLPGLEHAALQKVHECLKYIAIIKSKNSSKEVKEKAIIKTQKILIRLSHSELKNVINASDYLHIKKLFDQTCREWRRRSFAQREMRRLHTERSVFTQEEYLFPPEVDNIIAQQQFTLIKHYICTKHIKEHPLYNKQIMKGTHAFYTICFNHDDSLIAAGSSDTIYIFTSPNRPPTQTLAGHTDNITCVCFNPVNTNQLASTSYDHSIRIWDLTRNTADILSGHTNVTESVAFSPNGTLIATTSDDKTIRVWNIAQKTCLYIINKHTKCAWKLFFNSDNILTSAAFDKTVRRWRLEKNAIVQEQEFTGSYGELCFNKKQTLFATDTNQSVINLVDNKTGSLIKELRGHTDIIYHLTFNHDDTLLASASKDKTIRIWDVESGECLKILDVHNNIVTEIHFSSDGYTLISAAMDKTLHMWKLLGKEKQNILAQIKRHITLEQAQFLWLAITQQKNSQSFNIATQEHLYNIFATWQSKRIKKFLLTTLGITDTSS